MRGEVYRLPARGKGHEQNGRRFAVVLQPDWLTLSTWIVAFTSSSARETTFRPSVTIADRHTLVMCDQRHRGFGPPHRADRLPDRRRDATGRRGSRVGPRP
ncbi:MAG: type II toxin-antitoxin system PemK/MazF family toxin [Nocardioidaceae bacterium]